MTVEPIYLDYNATTPLDPAVVEAMRPYLDTHFGNPSSSHVYGTRTKQAVEQARRQVAEMLGASPDEIIFTSGGSESNNLAIRGAAASLREKGNHIITSAVEHPAVIEVCRHLETQGFRVTYVPVDEYGYVDPAEIAKALSPATVLVTIMHANNEVGTIQPIREIADLVRPRGILMHTDAAQSIGKIPARVADLGVDLLSIAGHKLYATQRNRSALHPHRRQTRKADLRCRSRTRLASWNRKRARDRRLRQGLRTGQRATRTGATSTYAYCVIACTTASPQKSST